MSWRRFEWPAIVIVAAQSKKEAVDSVNQFERDVNKNPDGPHVFVDNDGEPYEEEMQ